MTILHFGQLKPNCYSYEVVICFISCTNISSSRWSISRHVIFFSFRLKCAKVWEYGKKVQFYKTSKFSHFHLTSWKDKNTKEYLGLSLFYVPGLYTDWAVRNMLSFRNRKGCPKGSVPPYLSYFTRFSKKYKKWALWQQIVFGTQSVKHPIRNAVGDEFFFTSLGGVRKIFGPWGGLRKYLGFWKSHSTPLQK